MTLGQIISRYRSEHGNMSMEEFAKRADLSKGYISMLEKNEHPKTGLPIRPGIDTIKKVSLVVGIDFDTIISCLDDDTEIDLSLPLSPPIITESTVMYPVIGDVAAGYDQIAVEDWEGDTIEIPTSFLQGHSREDFFVLRVKGDSMYPEYHPGDRVLVLKQSTLNNSGDIGVILYDGEYGTLKKVEYSTGKDWMKLVPLNPNYPPKIIEGQELENCIVLGVPKLLIRAYD